MSVSVEMTDARFSRGKAMRNVVFFVIHRFKIICHIDETDVMFFCILRKHFGMIRLAKTNGSVGVDGLKGMKHHNDLRVIFSIRLKANVGKEYYIKYFMPVENATLITPRKYCINPHFLEWHRDCIFNKQ